MSVEPLTNVKNIARLAGGLYVSLVPLGFYSFVYVPSVVFVRGDTDATARNILSSEALFRTGVASHLISQIVVVFLALTMYRLLHVVSRHRAATMVALALMSVPISFLAEANSLAALHVLSRAGDGAIAAKEVREQAMLFLDLQRSGVLLAQVFWGLWMLPLSSLVFESGFVPRWLAIPVLIAGAGYLFDSAAHVLLSGAQMISQFTAVGELPLPLWLLIRGVDRQQWRERSQP